MIMAPSAGAWASSTASGSVIPDPSRSMLLGRPRDNGCGRPGSSATVGGGARARREVPMPRPRGLARDQSAIAPMWRPCSPRGDPGPEVGRRESLGSVPESPTGLERRRARPGGHGVIQSSRPAVATRSSATPRRHSDRARRVRAPPEQIAVGIRRCINRSPARGARLRRSARASTSAPARSGCPPRSIGHAAVIRGVQAAIAPIASERIPTVAWIGRGRIGDTAT